MELSQLLAVPKPIATNTYSPISHDEIHDTIMKEIKDNAFSLTNTYIKSRNGKNCIVMYSLVDDLASYQDPEIGIRVGFKNSYDRTMSFGFALGSEVFICGNGMVSGEYTIKKQHRMKDVSIYAKELIHNYFGQIRAEHNDNLAFAKELKSRDVTEADAQRIIGELFINNKIITQAQLRKMSSEMYNSDKFNSFKNGNDITAWDLYNHGTESLKTSANFNLFNRHIEYNEYFRRNFGIGC